MLYLFSFFFFLRRLPILFVHDGRFKACFVQTDNKYSTYITFHTIVFQTVFIPNILALSAIHSSQVCFGRILLGLCTIHLFCSVLLGFLRSSILIACPARPSQLCSLANSDTGGSLYTLYSSWLNLIL